MDNKLHLHVLKDSADNTLSSASPLTLSPEFDVQWSHGFAAYRVDRLRWFDEASYIRYQGDLDE